MIKDFAAIVLAAGKGTRLASGAPSPKPKVLYKLAGQPMISYTLDLLRGLGMEEVVVVVGHQAEKVRKTVGKDFKVAYQDKRLGTGHAVKIGLALVTKETKEVLVLNGDDSAFYNVETVWKVLKKHIGKGNTVTFVSLEPANPRGLGRVVRDGENVLRIVEEKDAGSKEKKIKEVNDGLYVFRRDWLEKNLPKLKKSQVGEYYLVDLIELAVNQGKKVSAYKLDDPSQWLGVNTPEELETADKEMRKRTKDAS